MTFFLKNWPRDCGASCLPENCPYRILMCSADSLSAVGRELPTTIPQAPQFLILALRSRSGRPTKIVPSSGMPQQTSPRVEFFSFLAVAISFGGWLVIILQEWIRGELRYSSV